MSRGRVGVVAPAPAPAGPDHYTFLATQTAGGSGDPVTWDPCRHVHFATSGLAPREGQELLASAFSRVSDITGLQLVNDGPTSEPADYQRASFQPDRYGDRWAPILVAWTTPREVPELSGMTIGLGGSQAVSDASGHLTYITGILFLDLPQIEEQLSEAALAGTSASRRSQIRAIMMHEIGHIMGLGHADDPSQLMYPVAGSVTDFGAGDLRGFARLTSGPCVPGL